MFAAGAEAAEYPHRVGRWSGAHNPPRGTSTVMVACHTVHYVWWWLLSALNLLELERPQTIEDHFKIFLQLVKRATAGPRNSGSRWSSKVRCRLLERTYGLERLLSR